MIWLTTLALAAPQTPLQEHMQGHFAYATDAMWYTATGDLDKAREEAAKLDHPADGAVPDELKPLVANLRTVSLAIAKAENQERAGQQVGRLSAACASCHIAAEDGPRIAKDKVSHLGHEGPSHLWGVYGMWVGLVLPEDPSWSEGVALLDPSRLTAHPRYKSVEAVAQQFAAHTAAAARANSHRDRAEIFGKLLSTCKTCHDALEIDL